jgi:hypothetical protein
MYGVKSADADADGERQPQYFPYLYVVSEFLVCFPYFDKIKGDL